MEKETKITDINFSGIDFLPKYSEETTTYFVFCLDFTISIKFQNKTGIIEEIKFGEGLVSKDYFEIQVYYINRYFDQIRQFRGR